ncbi:hypothetical protein DPEC_G00243650 [Dallia pectoralis]|uniref:Uncharacterized protein n=1 Tax=Dallia pectoralis TaxID=75939 RepID=A0ACC2FVH3_DALPE|nr:hypothetical protein DPEC_G00243650 [Dallia pectoralis]
MPVQGGASRELRFHSDDRTQTFRGGERNCFPSVLIRHNNVIKTSDVAHNATRTEPCLRSHYSTFPETHYLRYKERGAMNLNDFVVVSSNPKSVKLNPRNLRELRMETVTLADESEDMEQRLRRLKESMGREKEERERSGWFRWKSGQLGAPKNHGAKRNKENELGKSSAGKLKIRVLQDETGPEVRGVLEKDKAPAPLSGARLTSRKSRLRGKVCGQCEAKNAGLMCAECGEDYCVGCFVKFHQKGALKLHRTVPIQTEIQTSVSTLDVVSQFQRQVQLNPNLDSHSGKGAPSGIKGRTQPTPAVTNSHNAQGSQVLFVDCPREEKELDEREMDDEPENEELAEVSTLSLLGGVYDEETSARSFKEALGQWRGEGGGRGEGGDREQVEERGDTIRRPHLTRPVAVKAMGTQADLSDAGDERGPVKVEFAQFTVSYMERLLLKRHRRTPIEAHQPPAFLASSRTSTTPPPAEQVTGEDEEFRRYCASLFAVSPRGGAVELEPSSGSCPSIKEPDETVSERGFVAEPKAEDNTNGGPEPSHNALDREIVTPRPPSLYKSETTQLPRPDRSAVRSPRFSAGFRQLKSQRTQRTPHTWTGTPGESPGPRPSTPDNSSPRPPPFRPDVDLRPGGPPSSIPPGPNAPRSLRSTFTLSPRSPTETPSTPLPEDPRGSGCFNPSSPTRDSPDRFSPPTPQSPCDLSSPSPSRSTGFQSPSQQLLTGSYRTRSSPGPLLNTSPGSPLSSRSQQEPGATESPLTRSDALSSRSTPYLSQESLHARYRNSPPPAYECALLSRDVSSAESSPRPLTPSGSPADPLSSTHVSSQSNMDAISTQQNTTQSYTGAQTLALSPSPISLSRSSGSLRNYSSQETPRLLSGLGVRQSCSPAFSPGISETDSDAESSGDSLGLTPLEEDSSDEKMKLNACSQEWRSNAAETQGRRLLSDSAAVSSAGGSPEPKTGELAPEPSAALLAVAQREQTQPANFRGLEGFLTLGLENRSSPHLSSRPRHSPPDTEDGSNALTTGEDSWRASSSHRGHAEEHLIKTMMMDSQRQPISSHGDIATHTQRGPSSPHGLYLSGFTGVSVQSAPELSSRPASAGCRPLSRAAREIQDVGAVDQAGCEDPDLDHDMDTRALSSLAEEYMLMATDTPQLFSSHGVGAGTVEHDRIQESDRLRISRVHSDDEEGEEIRRDQQSVLSLS